MSCSKPANEKWIQTQISDLINNQPADVHVFIFLKRKNNTPLSEVDFGASCMLYSDFSENVRF